MCVLACVCNLAAALLYGANISDKSLISSCQCVGNLRACLNTKCIIHVLYCKLKLNCIARAHNSKSILSDCDAVKCSLLFNPSSAPYLDTKDSYGELFRVLHKGCSVARAF